MLHVYYGTDRQAVRDAATNAVPRPGLGTNEEVTLTVFDAAEYQPGQLADALGAASLFGGAEWYMIDTPSSNPDCAEEVKENLAAMKESSNTFIVLEGALLAPAKKAYAKHAASVEEFTTAKAERFNTFAMADALAQKDRRQSWMLLTEAKQNGLAAEEIIGMLWWQLKAMRLAQLTSSAQEAGMKDFPYNKAKRSLATFAPGEVAELSYSLQSLYHAGHAGERDIDLALEEWVLSGK